MKIVSEKQAKQTLRPGVIVCLSDVDYRIKEATKDAVYAVPVEWDDERVFDDDYIEVGTPDKYTYTDFIGAVYVI